MCIGWLGEASIPAPQIWVLPPDGTVTLSRKANVSSAPVAEKLRGLELEILIIRTLGMHRTIYN